MILDVFNKNLVRIVSITNYSYANYVEQLNSQGKFEVRVFYDDKAEEIFENGYLLLLEKDVCGIISYKKPQINEDSGEIELILKGFLLNSLLSRRCISLTTEYSGTIPVIIYAILNEHVVNPSVSARALPIVLKPLTEEQTTGQTQYIQVTGKSVKDKIEELLDPIECGYKIEPVYGVNAITGFKFSLLEGVDHTIGNAGGNSIIVFSKDLRNVLSNSYEINSNDYKNVAYVAAQGEGSSRALEIVGETASSNLDRFELFVDARDIDITVSNYRNSMINRGKEKLKEHILSETYSATIDPIQSRYTYKEDYFLGDYVTIKDRNLGIELVTQITEVEVSSIGERVITDLTFGNYKLTTNQKLERGGLI